MIGKNDEYWMYKALELAQFAWKRGEIPIGAILVHNQQLISKGWNCSINNHDPTAHAEIIVLRNAGKVLQNYRLLGTTLYVTLEPCIMCAGAIIHGRINRLVFGAYHQKFGAARSIINMLDNLSVNHKIHIFSGVLEKKCANILSEFFRIKRREKKISNLLITTKK